MRRRTALAMTVVAAFVLASCRRGDAPPAPPPPEVVVAVAKVGSVPDHREYVGNVRAVNEVEVRARVRGYLLERRFAEGQHVAADEVLFVIDPREYEVALRAAQGQLAQTRATAQRTERDFERARSLFKQGVASQAQLDEARAERDVAAAAVQSAEAAVANAELDLSYCTVRAPYAGQITRALVDVGNLVGESGQDTPLARIVQIDPIHVYFAPTERDRLDVLRGAREGRIPEQRVGNVPVEIRLDDGTLYPHRGVLDYVDPTIDASRGTVTVRAIVDNPDAVLKPGQFVRATAIFPDRTGVVLVPETAIQEEQAGSIVYTVKPDDVVESRRVKLGLLHEGWREIAEGVAAGERVIVEGMQKARPGQKVVARAAATPPAAPVAEAPR
jgi:RND family efflux transporter MFP subunit